jgi:L-ascorbate metabolism protein UlaG (beta-lactamase superfamily)
MIVRLLQTIMNITWHGSSCFRIQENSSGSDVTIVIDPFHPEGKAQPPRGLSGDLLLISRDHPAHNNAGIVGGDPFVITGPGEYEIKEASIIGVSTADQAAEPKDRVDNTMFYINLAGLHLLFLGDLTHPLNESHYKDLHAIDVLFVPVGGKDVLGAKQAAEVIGQLEPRVIIPMHFQVGNFLPEYESVTPFLKAMGSADVEPVAKLKLTEKDMPQEEMKIIVLDPQ